MLSARNVYDDSAVPMQPKKQKIQPPGTTDTPSDPIPYMTGQRSGEDAVFQF